MGFAMGTLFTLLALRLKEEGDKDSVQGLYERMDSRIAELEGRAETLRRSEALVGAG